MWYREDEEDEEDGLCSADRGVGRGEEQRRKVTEKGKRGRGGRGGEEQRICR